MRYISHGEVNLLELEKLPKGLKKIEVKEDTYKLANSEVTGNHHLVKTQGVEFYEDKKGTLYMRVLQDTEVSCVDTKRHDTVTLPASVWVRKPALEVDHFTGLSRDVVD